VLSLAWVAPLAMIEALLRLRGPGTILGRGV